MGAVRSPEPFGMLDAVGDGPYRRRGATPEPLPPQPSLAREEEDDAGRGGWPCSWVPRVSDPPAATSFKWRRVGGLAPPPHHWRVPKVRHRCRLGAWRGRA